MNDKIVKFIGWHKNYVPGDVTKLPAEEAKKLEKEKVLEIVKDKTEKSDKTKKKNKR